MDQVKKAADEYNKIAAVAAKAGIQQGLHNEGFELAMVDGKRVYDMLFDLLDPKLVKFQFQMSTIDDGLVAADYFTKYPGRFFSMHVQDVDMNDAGRPPAACRRTTACGTCRCAVGKGSIDWVKTFQAAKVGGVKNYFVEQSMAADEGKCRGAEGDERIGWRQGVVSGDIGIQRSGTHGAGHGGHDGS